MDEPSISQTDNESTGSTHPVYLTIERVFHSKFFLIGIAVIIAGVLLGIIFIDALRGPQQTINSFEDCVAAGNPVMESYPRQCRTKDGQHFVEQIPDKILFGEEATALCGPEPPAACGAGQRLGCRSSDKKWGCYPSEQEFDTSSWQTYRNDKFGYEIKYPQDWKIDISDEFLGDAVLYKGEKLDIGPPADPYANTLRLTIYNRGDDGNCGDCSNFQLFETKIAGYKANVVQNGFELFEILWIYSPNEQKIVRINYGYPSKEMKNETNKALFDQILSTFRFLNSDTTQLHQDCTTITCSYGQECVSYYGIAGPNGPEFHTCEIPCMSNADCPAGLSCVTVADGPGQVCY